MDKSLLRTDEDIGAIYQRHMQMVYRVCFAYMKNSADTEDAVSETFYKMIQSKTVFKNAEHEKAWLIRVASNVCKNTLKHWWRKNKALDECMELKGDDNVEIDSTLSAVLELPDKYKTVVYLYYYEEYNTAEIAAFLRKPHSTIRNHLHEARKLLRKKLGGDFHK